MVDGVISSVASLPPQALKARMASVVKKARLQTRMGERRDGGVFMKVRAGELTQP
jgi:hypothetical protein